MTLIDREQCDKALWDYRVVPGSRALNSSPAHYKNMSVSLQSFREEANPSSNDHWSATPRIFTKCGTIRINREAETAEGRVEIPCKLRLKHLLVNLYEKTFLLQSYRGERKQQDQIINPTHIRQQQQRKTAKKHTLKH